MCMYACMCVGVCVYVRMYVCMYVCIMYVCMYICTYVCVYVCNVCMYCNVMYAWMDAHTCMYVIWREKICGSNSGGVNRYLSSVNLPDGQAPTHIHRYICFCMYLHPKSKTTRNRKPVHEHQ
jgi:hypothetical protein